MKMYKISEKKIKTIVVLLNFMAKEYKRNPMTVEEFIKVNQIVEIEDK